MLTHAELHPNSGIPAYGISFQTNSSTLATTTTPEGIQTQIYQTWTRVVPQGAPGDTNTTETDVCGTQTNSFNGNWKYSQLIQAGVSSLSSPSLSFFSSSSSGIQVARAVATVEGRGSALGSELTVPPSSDSVFHRLSGTAWIYSLL